MRMLCMTEVLHVRTTSLCRASQCIGSSDHIIQSPCTIQQWSNDEWAVICCIYIYIYLFLPPPGTLGLAFILGSTWPNSLYSSRFRNLKKHTWTPLHVQRSSSVGLWGRHAEIWVTWVTWAHQDQQLKQIFQQSFETSLVSGGTPSSTWGCCLATGSRWASSCAAERFRRLCIRYFDEIQQGNGTQSCSVCSFVDLRWDGKRSETTLERAHLCWGSLKYIFIPHERSHLKFSSFWPRKCDVFWRHGLPKRGNCEVTLFHFHRS